MNPGQCYWALEQVGRLEYRPRAIMLGAAVHSGAKRAGSWHLMLALVIWCCEQSDGWQYSASEVGFCTRKLIAGEALRPVWLVRANSVPT